MEWQRAGEWEWEWEEDTSNALAEHAPAVISYDDEWERAVQSELELRRARYGDGESEPAPPAAPAENAPGERAAPEPVVHFHADATRICVWWGRRCGG